MKRYYIFLGCLVVVLPLDQITKYLIDGAVALHQSIVVIPGFFNITYVRNPGAAFGFLAGAPSFVRSLFLIVLSLAAMALILYYLIRSASRDLLMSTALSLVFSGAVGNLI
ncbi:MAG: signal peptidase II, partial [Deltaproteobacteria bacterium]|nr:signal peptidase II [Deltaproteobacteria bacterium]